MIKLTKLYAILFLSFMVADLRAEIFCMDVVTQEKGVQFREIPKSPWSNDVKNSLFSYSGFLRGKSRADVQVIHDMYYRVDEPKTVQSKGWKLLIHGLGDHSGRLNDLTDLYLNDGFRVVRVDLFGHGRTLWRSLKNNADVDETVDIRSNALAIIEILDHLNIKDVEITGHSLGGAVALLTGAYSVNILDRKKEIKISKINLIAFYAQDLSEWMASQALIGANINESVAKGVQFFAPQAISQNITNNIDNNTFILNQFFSTADAIFRFLGFTNLKNSIADPNLAKFLYNSYAPYFEEYAKANGLNIDDPQFKKELDQQIRSAISVTRGARKFNLFHPSQLLPRSEIPIHIVAAEKDELVPLSMMKQAQLTLKKIGFKVQLTVIKAAGHLLTRTHAEEVHEALKKKK